MQRWSEILFGIEPTTWAEGGRWSLDWLALPRGDRMLLVLAALLGIVVGLWWLYRREAPQVSAGRRALLMGLRLAAVALAACMLFEPIIVLSREEFIPSQVLVLVDDSESMSLRDAWRDESVAQRVVESFKLDKGIEGLRSQRRLDLVQKLLTPDFVKALEANGDHTVQVRSFDSALGDTLDPAATAPLEPHGETTAIGDALQQAMIASAGQPVAGIVLVTDGQSTAGQPLDEATKLAADEGIAVSSVAVGTVDGPRNVEITEVEANPVAFIGDPNRLTVHLQSRGMQDVSATLLIEQRRNGGDWVEFVREPLVLGMDGALQQVTHEFNEPRPAKLEFRVSLIDTGGELSDDDNTGRAEVRLIRQRLRVLFIAGSTFPEVQFLRNSFYRDRGIEVSSWLMSADEDYEQPGDSPIQRLPVTQEELNDYDCVVLYDPDPARWPANFPELLTNFVSKAGGGLIYIAGEFQTAAAFDRQGDPAMDWLNLLPVVREAGLFRSEIQMRLSARTPWRLEVTELGLTDPILTFAADAEANRRIVESLPGMYWHFPVTRAKPGATVLAVHGDPRMRNEYGPEVLLATHLVGPGRVIFLGFDSTYRWRFLDDQFFDGFWARVVDRAGRNKQLGGEYPFRVTTPQPTYKPNSDVRVIARFHDVSAVEPGLDALHGEVEHSDDDPVSLTLTREDDGVYAASFPAPRPGTYFVRVWMGDEAAGETASAATLPIEVQLPDVEFENPILDRGALQSLAEATGGRVFELDQSKQIPTSFAIGKVRRVLEDRQEIWDAPALMGTIFLLLVAEWILRKRCRMI